MSIKSVVICGKRWQSRTSGSTYFSAMAFVDGEIRCDSIRMEYGGGDHYKDQMLARLIKENVIPSKNKNEAWWQYSERTGIIISGFVADVAREKDL